MHERGVNPNHIDIEVVHRIGPKPDNKNTNKRQLVAKISRRDYVDKILASTKNDGPFDKDAIRITRQVPTQDRHATAKLYHIADIIKKKAPRAEVNVEGQAIYVNGNRRKPPLNPPTLEETLTTEPNTVDTLNNIKFYFSDCIAEKNSTFIAVSTPIVSIQDARRAYLAISRVPGIASASHLITAYISKQGDFDYIDDGDHGLGRFTFGILEEKELDGIMIFLSRDYGGIHLGKRRYTIINTIVKQAIGKLIAAIEMDPNIATPSNLHATNLMPSNPQMNQPQAQPQPAQPAHQVTPMDTETATDKTDKTKNKSNYKEMGRDPFALIDPAAQATTNTITNGDDNEERENYVSQLIASAQARDSSQQPPPSTSEHTNTKEQEKSEPFTLGAANNKQDTIKKLMAPKKLPTNNQDAKNKAQRKNDNKKTKQQLRRQQSLQKSPPLKQKPNIPITDKKEQTQNADPNNTQVTVAEQRK